MKNIKLFILILFIGLVACKPKPRFQENTQNPIVEKNIVKYHEKSFPKPIGYINDFEKIFTEEQIKSLEKTISDYEKKTSKEIVIVSINSIKPYSDIKDFATDLSNDWAVGKFEKDNGLTIIFSKNLKKIRISTGTGTEIILTDKICKKVIDETMIPEFKKGDYYNGIEKGLEELISKWK